MINEIMIMAGIYIAVMPL